MKRFVDILNEIGTPGQYKSPEALARQSQQKESALIKYRSLKRSEQELSRQISELTTQLKQIKSEIAGIEQDYMNHTDLDEYEF